MAAPGFAAESPATIDHTDLTGQVTAIFEQHCAKCHGPAGVRQYSEAKGGFDYVLDLDRLATSAKLITPGDPSGSKLAALIERDEMPDGADVFAEEPLTEDEKAVVRQWISALADREIDREFITDQQILDAIASDFASLSPPRRETARYLTLTHLHNGGEPDDRMEIYRQGVTKLLNSLSWQPRVVKPVAVDEARTVLRVDLEDLGWSPDIWEDIAEFNLNEGNLNTAAYNAALADEARVILYGEATPVGSGARDKRDLFGRMDKGTAPFVYLKADWFAFVTSRPPMYHDILDLGLTVGGLEKRLGVERKRNIERHRVARAGVSDSGVGLNNRLIERHDALFGAYWISYDFAEQFEEQDLLQHPLGPYGLNAFESDGGEVIFNLPNGFQAYLLATDEGFRIDKAPTQIVQDANHPTDSTIINGISCISCHADGMNAATDDVRTFVQNAGTFSVEEIAEVEALYPPDDEFQELLAADREIFFSALRAAGVDPSLRDPQGNEPVTSLVRRFERPLDLKLAAAEFGLEAEAFANQLAFIEREELATVPVRLEHSNLPRDQFVASFEAIKEIIAGGEKLAAVTTPALAPELLTTPPPKAKPSAAQAYAAADFATASELWRDAAERGNAQAQYNLAVLYTRGEGVPQDLEKALGWYRRAAEGGFLEAAYVLGVLHNEGRFVEQDFDAALRWFERAAAQGHVSANQQAQLLKQLTPPSTQAPRLQTVGPELLAAATEPNLPFSTAFPSTGWHVQLASLPDANLVPAVWQHLQERHSDVLGGLGMHIARADKSRGPQYGLQVGPVADQVAAQSVCLRLQSQDQECQVVRP